ncbi:MAG: T9SS type A sorting domain-containing protein [Bacteroidales bacterium]|nr:T9SS type A sorting domain-containing protein [Bacteroidales bacterium]
MKKTVILFLVLLATMATVNSQTGTVGVRDLNYRSLNWLLPISVSDTLHPTTPLLDDVRSGAPAIGYAIDVPNSVTLKIAMEASFDSYLYLLDANFAEVAHNDDAQDFSGSELVYRASAGRYYILASTYEHSQPTDNLDFVLTVDTTAMLTLQQLTWHPLPASLTIEDSLTETDTVLGELRVGAPARGYTFVLANPTMVMIDMACSFDSYLYLLDNNYQELERNDDGGDGSRIVKMLDPGTYRIVATTYSSSPVSHTQTFTVSVQLLGNGVMLRDLAATAITLGNTVADSLISTTPMLGELKAGSLAKQYTFRAEQDSVIQVELQAFNYNATAYLLDSAYNTIANEGNSIMTMAPYSGLYRLIVCSSNPLEEEEYTVFVDSYRLPVFYVDPANGDDSNNGLTAQTPVASLDSMLSAQNGVGAFYLMADYTFTNTLSFTMGALYPYRRSINFSVDTTLLGNSALIEAQGDFALGRSGDGDYRMIFDSVYAPNVKIIDSWTPITLNNITVSNSNMKGLFSGSNVKGENLVVNNDTIENDILQASGNLLLSNSVISDNYAGTMMAVYSWTDEAQAMLLVDDCEITNNATDSPVAALNAIVKLNAGRYSGNEYVGDDVPPVLAVAGGAGLGGIMAVVNSTVEFGPSFNMDTNSFLFLDTTSRIIVEENYDHVMAKILPMVVNMETGSFGLGYVSGHQVLTGSAVATNYSRFVLAQFDGTNVWSLRADGKMYSSTDGIDTPVVADCTIYPNPTVNSITVSVEGLNADRVVVVDMQGRKVAQQVIKGQKELVDMQHLNSGVYFVQLLSGDAVMAVGKVIKK